MVRAMLIDLDGVLRIWHSGVTAKVEERTGLPIGAILRTAFDPTLLQPAITGRVDDGTWRRLIAQRLRANYPDADGDLAVNMWSESPGELDLEMLSLIQSCRKSIAVVQVTNATTRLHTDLQRLGLTATFDQIINSATVGCAKPDREIFVRALASVGVTESEAFFVDDSAANVIAAREFGIAGHLYTGVSQLRAALEHLGLIREDGRSAR